MYSPLGAIWLILNLNKAFWSMACSDLEPRQCKNHSGSLFNQLFNPTQIEQKCLYVRG